MTELWDHTLARKSIRLVANAIDPFGTPDQVRLARFGLIGSITLSIFGTGINVFIFCLGTIYYRLSEKVSTPSSVIIMTFETLLGFFLHAGVLGDFNQESFELWLAAFRSSSFLRYRGRL